MARQGYSLQRAAAFVLALVVWVVVPSSARAQSSEDELGTWLIYNGDIRFSERWSLFTETQLRLYEVASDVNEFLARAAGHYHFSPRMHVGLGCLRSEVWAFQGGAKTTENRLYEQFAIKHVWSRPVFEHRFRLEQRWVTDDGSTDFRGRFRYRLQITTPLNRPKLEPRTHFFNFYDELFLNVGDRPETFDQNRFYVAYGRQFTRLANLQLGLLWQNRSSGDFFRLQVFYTHNFDLRNE